MADRSLFRRKRFIVKKGLQFRYIGVIFILAILASIVTGFTVFITGWTLLGEKLASVYPQGRLLYVFKATNMVLIRNLIFVSPVIFVLGLLFSHKIAGPVYRIEKAIYEVSKGNLSLNVKLRKGDELWDLAEILNTMIENLNRNVSSNKDSVLNIQKDIDTIKKIVSNESCDPTLIKSSLDDLQLKINELNSSLNQWKGR